MWEKNFEDNKIGQAEYRKVTHMFLYYHKLKKIDFFHVKIFMIKTFHIHIYKRMYNLKNTKTSSRELQITFIRFFY